MNRVIENLWISDIDSARTRDTSRFDRVISVCQDSVRDNVSCPNLHFELADGPDDQQGHVPGEYSYTLLSTAITATVDSIDAGDCTLLHCHQGISRSAAVAIGAVATTNDVDYYTAYEIVREGRNCINPNPDIVDDVKRYIEENA